MLEVWTRWNADATKRTAGVPVDTSDVDVLFRYTEWLREMWAGHLAEHEGALGLDLGPNADARFRTVGEVIRHVFGAEARYVDRVLGREARDVGSVPRDSVGALFEFGALSRSELRDLVRDDGQVDWSESRIFPIGRFEFEGPAWAIVVHSLIHEVRHWAQLGTILRMNGMGPGLHDFIVSPVHGGEFRRRQP